MQKHFASTRLPELDDEIARLMNPPTFGAAVSILSKADQLFNAELLAKLQAKVGDDESIAAFLGLPEMIKNNKPLSSLGLQHIESQLPELRKAAKNLRNAAERYLSDNPELSRDGCNYVKSLAEQYIREGNFITGVEDLKNAANTQKWRETQFDFGLNYEVKKRHAEWSVDQKTFFREVMTMLHKGHEDKPLFAVGHPSMADRVADRVTQLFTDPANDTVGQHDPKLQVLLIAAQFAPYLSDEAEAPSQAWQF